MTPAVARLLFLQLVLGPTVFMDFSVRDTIKKFRNLYVDYPRVSYPPSFKSYCNGLMNYVRGIQQSWQCPSIHYVIHAPWKAIRQSSKNCENFCKNYNEYCVLTQEAFPITICSRLLKEPPTTCRYNSTLTNRRVYLLCSEKYNGVPIGIFGIE